jgi:hypothetical protein
MTILKRYSFPPAKTKTLSFVPRLFHLNFIADPDTLTRVTFDCSKEPFAESCNNRFLSCVNPLGIQLACLCRSPLRHVSPRSSELLSREQQPLTNCWRLTHTKYQQATSSRRSDRDEAPRRLHGPPTKGIHNPV